MICAECFRVGRPMLPDADLSEPFAAAALTVEDGRALCAEHLAEHYAARP